MLHGLHTSLVAAEPVQEGLHAFGKNLNARLETLGDDVHMDPQFFAEGGEVIIYLPESSVDLLEPTVHLGSKPFDLSTRRLETLIHLSLEARHARRQPLTRHHSPVFRDDGSIVFFRR
jgi:hypothetical protein